MKTGPTREELTGKKLYQLTFLEYKGSYKWLVKCDCGNEKIIRTSAIKRGMTKSCGCLNKHRKRKHGGAYDREHRIWTSMKQRCSNPKSTRFEDYGGRGIKVCKRWANSYKNFISDMGFAPTNDHSIDRINNYGDYTPKNCKWSTRSEQQQNRRNTQWIEHNGIKMPRRDWAKKWGIWDGTLYRHLKRGKTMEMIEKIIAKGYHK